MSKDNKPLTFTVNEQNCLAMICQVMAYASHKVSTQDSLSSLQRDAICDDLASIAERFPSVNWGDLYDRFHRQGANT